MKTAIIALTCGRINYTRQTFAHNFKDIDTDVFIWDNSETPEERAEVIELCAQYPQVKAIMSEGVNIGIAHGLNRLLKTVFVQNNYDMAITMGNDILEPPGWVSMREHYAQAIPRVGIVSTPLKGAARYAIQLHGDCYFEHGHIIGNFGITRELFERIGYMPEVYGVYGPIDLEYCDKAQAAGYKTIYISTITPPPVHIGDDSPAEYQDKKMRSLQAAWPIYHDRKRRIGYGEQVD
jgi:GT2 family glycosyltransferase